MTARILEPGIYSLDELSYHRDPTPVPSLSASVAKIILAQSPAHAWLSHPRLNPNYQPVEDSRFDFGSAAHCMLLERTSNPIIWIDALDWRTKAAKEARDAARDAGKLPVLVRYHDDLYAMVEAARKAIDRSELSGILSGAAEQTIVWNEGETWLRGRMDMLADDRRVVLDYKSVDDAEPNAFIRQIARVGYDVQSAFYERGMLALGHKIEFVFLAQEITAPYACSLVGMSNAYKDLGRIKVARAIERWSGCMATGEWPSYGHEIRYAEPPPWELSEIDAR